MPYKCLTYVMVGEEKKAPGDSVTKAEFVAAGQTTDDIAILLKTGAISEDADAPIHKDHGPVPAATGEHVIQTSDGGAGVDRN